MNRLICDCMKVYECQLRKSFKKNNGNLDKIKDETQAAIACKRCLKEESVESKKVDITFPNFIKELEKEK